MSKQEHVRQMSPRARLLLALALFFFGGFLLAFVFGWIPAKLKTPTYVAASAASVFILGGVLVLLAESEWLAWLRNLAAWLFVVCLSVPFNWAAFGEGERQFSGSSSFLGFTSSSATGETEGRVVFGLFAVLMDIMIVLVPLRLLKKRNPE